MSGTGEATADFAGEERTFRIRLGEIRHIEQKCETGIGEVCRRLARAAYVTSKFGGLEALATGIEIHAEDVRAPIYEGLVGAGTRPADATRLVRQEIDDRGLRGLLDNAAVALMVLLGSQDAPKDEASPGGGSGGGEPRDLKERTDFGQIYGVGAAIGLSPRQVDDLTFWEFCAAVRGWKAAHCPDDEGAAPPSDAEHDALVAKYG